MKCLGLHNKPKAEVHLEHMLTGGGGGGSRRRGGEAVGEGGWGGGGGGGEEAAAAAPYVISSRLLIPSATSTPTQAVIRAFRVIIGPAEYQDIASQIVTDQPQWNQPILWPHIPVCVIHLKLECEDISQLTA